MSLGTKYHLSTSQRCLMSRLTNPRALKVKPLTIWQVEVLEAIHYGEVALEVEPGVHANGYSTYFDKSLLLGVDVSSVVAKLKESKFIRVRIDNDVRGKWQTAYRYYVLTPAGMEELEKHPAPWKD